MKIDEKDVTRVIITMVPIDISILLIERWVVEHNIGFFSFSVMNSWFGSAIVYSTGWYPLSYPFPIFFLVALVFATVASAFAVTIVFLSTRECLRVVDKFLIKDSANERTLFFTKAISIGLLALFSYCVILAIIIDNPTSLGVFYCAARVSIVAAIWAAYWAIPIAISSKEPNYARIWSTVALLAFATALAGLAGIYNGIVVPEVVEEFQKTLEGAREAVENLHKALEALE
ncbi:MAG: hypothetical protein MPK06_02610 [Alphaproteobacteria bacterium]|nr:hypothetical protein [Alphaproteobacteria bacterium]MDA8004475.1 hypothetical protein [Alphaproteobacteria bacterium]MDA8005419.1 hypothetical protein [Alphaproteobacteria bacterium]MDA8012558.1 hypothetical protein [Alphaproteobacteria bacterium]